MFVGDRFDVAGSGRALEQVERRQFDAERRGCVEFEGVRARLARGVSGAGEPAAAGAAGSVAGVVASAGGAAGIAGADRLAPGIVAAGCGGTTGDVTDGAAATFDTAQLAGDEVGAAGRANVVASMAAGAEAIDGAGAAVVAPKDVSEPEIG